VETSLPFRLLEHPSDIGLEVRGATAAEVFSNAARGLMHIIGESLQVREAEQRTVAISASDLPQLFVRWLSEILFLYDGERFLTAGAAVELIGETGLKAVVLGEPLDPQRHHVMLDVKAVTYHQLLIERRGDGWYARVVFDI
jgi:SHS2 domain-containing protein